MADRNEISIKIGVNNKELKSGLETACAVVEGKMGEIEEQNAKITPTLDLSKFDVSKIQAVLKKLEVNIDLKAQTPESMAGIQKTIKAYQNLQEKLERERNTLVRLRAEYKAISQAEGAGSSSAKELALSIKQQNVVVMGAVGSFKGLRNSLLQYGTTTDVIKNKNKGLTNSLSNVAKNAKIAGSGLKGNSGSMSSLIATASSLKSKLLALSSALGVGFAVKSIIDLNSKLEQSQIGLENLMGSSILAEQHLKELADFAAKTPFAFQELVDGSKRLQAFGISTQNVIPLMSALGNAVAAAGGDTETLNRAMLAVGQIQTKGKVQAEELMQLAEAGIPVYQILADKLGMTAEQVADIGNQGVNASRAIEALTAGLNEKFGGAMAAQSKSFAGVLNNLQDELKSFATKVGEAGFAEAKNQIADLLAMIENAKSEGTLDEWAERIGEALKAVVNCLAELIELFIELSDAINLPEILADCIESLTDFINCLADTVYEMKKLIAVFNDNSFGKKYGEAMEFITKKMVDFMPVISQMKIFKDKLQDLNGTAKDADGFAGLAEDLTKIENAIKQTDLSGVTEENIKDLEKIGVKVRESGDKWVYSWRIAGQDMERTVSKSNNGLAESMKKTTEKVNEALTKTGDIKGLDKLGVWVERSKKNADELVLMWQENGEILKKTVNKADLEVLKQRYAAQLQQNKELERLRADALKKESENLQKRKDMHKKISEEIAEINMTPLQKELHEVDKKIEEYRKAGAAEVDLANYSSAKKTEIYKKTAEEAKKAADEVRSVNLDLYDKILNLNGKELESKLFNLKKEISELRKKGANELNLARYVADSKKKIAEEAVKSQYGSEYDAVLEAIKAGSSIEEAYNKAHEEAVKLKDQEKQALQYVQEQTGLFAGTMQKMVQSYDISNKGGLSIVQKSDIVNLKGKIDQIFNDVGKVNLNLGNLSSEGKTAAESYFAPFKAGAAQIRKQLAGVSAMQTSSKAVSAANVSKNINNKFEINVHMDAKIYKEVDMNKTANTVADKIYEKVKGYASKYSY